MVAALTLLLQLVVDTIGNTNQHHLLSMHAMDKLDMVAMERIHVEDKNIVVLMHV
jgi:hypothetical protein